MCANMDALRSGLMLLVDDSQPIETRLPDAMNKVEGLGKATATAILLVVFPQQYGVWNETSEKGLARLDLLPQRERKTDGAYYVQMNDVFKQLSRRMSIDL